MDVGLELRCQSLSRTAVYRMDTISGLFPGVCLLMFDWM
uniref:Uncharacterized protein n=1 Tax=Anguilla anguilla TaxID=7936 RepID=A0A0E9QW26_ANGAN